MDSTWEGSPSAEMTDAEILIHLGYALAIDETVGRLREVKWATTSRLVAFVRIALRAYGFGLHEFNQFLPWY